MVAADTSKPKNDNNITINCELGMCCTGFDFSCGRVLPPYNSVQFQVIKTATGRRKCPELLEADEKDASVVVDGKKRFKLANMARSLEINYPVLVLEPSAARPLMSRWGNDTGIIPYTVVIARDGRIQYIHRGQMEQEDFDTWVKPLL